MGLKNFDYWSNKILDSNFPYLIKEQKIIRAVDLDRFIDCYNPSIKIVDCINKDVCIIEDKKMKKEITLLDINNVGKDYKKQLIKINKRISESWIVLVNDKFDFVLNEVIHFVENNNLLKIYDKIFLFNFFQSTIKELK